MGVVATPKITVCGLRERGVPRILQRMAKLVPCPQCRRHARSSDAACPFCGATLGPEVARAPLVPKGAKRAVLFAIGLSASAQACGAQAEGDSNNGALEGASPMASGSSSSMSTSSVTPSVSSSPTVDPDFGLQPIYGCSSAPLIIPTASSSSGSSSSEASGGAPGDTTPPPNNQVPAYGAVIPPFPEEAPGGSNDPGTNPPEQDASVAAGGSHDAGSADVGGAGGGDQDAGSSNAVNVDAGEQDAGVAADSGSAGGAPNGQQTAVPPYGAPPDLEQR